MASSTILDILLLFQSVRGCISILATLTYRLQQMFQKALFHRAVIQRNFLSIDMQLKENFQSSLFRLGSKKGASRFFH